MRGPRSQGARADHDRNRRNDHASAEKTGQGCVRPLRLRVHGFQRRAGIHVRTEESTEGPKQEMNRGFRLWDGLLCSGAACCAFLAPLFFLTIGTAAQNKSNGAAIDPEKIRAHVKFLSSDLLEGRGTG